MAASRVGRLTTTCDDAREVLAEVRSARAAVDEAVVRPMVAALSRAELHGVDRLEASATYAETALALAGPGAPWAGEFCVAALGAALGPAAHRGDGRPARCRRRPSPVLPSDLGTLAAAHGGIATLESPRRTVPADTVRGCAEAGVDRITVRPVLGLAERLHVTAYEVLDRLRDQVVAAPRPVTNSPPSADDITGPRRRDWSGGGPRTGRSTSATTAAPWTCSSATGSVRAG